MRKEKNQTAKEILKEYETMWITASTQFYQLKQSQPFNDFPALERHVTFCSTMYRYWEQIVESLFDQADAVETDADSLESEWGF